MQFRRVRGADLAGVLALQEDNLLENLSLEARQGGFLSARFTREQFTRMDADVAVLVAVDAERVAGYLCASSVEFNLQFPLLAAMIARFPDLSFAGRPLSEQTTCVYGPVCVDRGSRGRGVLRGMYRALLHELAGRYDSGVAFVSNDNARSLAAHVEGLGMTGIGEFEFNARPYRILAFAAGASSRDHAQSPD